MSKNKTIDVNGLQVSTYSDHQQDYISLTDIARYRDAERSDYILQNWLRNRSTIEFIGLWEKLNNPAFKSIEFDGFKSMAGSNSFSLTPRRWIDATNAIGITSRAGRYGGTFAHKDIAFEFASWISPEFKLYLIVEFQRLKAEENDRLKLEWNLQRTLAKINYRIHTDAIKEQLVPPTVTRERATMVYASEADLLNVALFGLTAKEWRDQNNDKSGNIRDHATLEQLVVLTNRESINAVLIRQQISAGERLLKLNEIAISQIKSLLSNNSIKKLK